MDQHRVTLDPKVEIPEDAPQTQDHDDDAAADAREAQQALADEAKAEGKREDVGARAPGDHAEPKKSAKKGD